MVDPGFGDARPDLGDLVRQTRSLRGFRTAAACVVLALGPCTAALAQTSSGCRAESTRSAVIGGVVGAAFMLGVSLGSDRDHRIAANERLPYLWGATWGATLGSTAGRITGRPRCPDVSMPRPLAAHAPDCARAAWHGAAMGAMGGGLTGFLMAPILLLIPAPAASLSGHPLDFNRAVIVVTSVGVMAGTPFGAYRAHEACR